MLKQATHSRNLNYQVGRHFWTKYDIEEKKTVKDSNGLLVFLSQAKAYLMERKIRMDYTRLKKL